MCDAQTQTEKQCNDKECQTTGPDVVVNSVAVGRDHTYAKKPSQTSDVVSIVPPELIPETQPQQHQSKSPPPPPIRNSDNATGEIDDVQKDPTYSPDKEDDQDDNDELPEERPFWNKTVEDCKYLVFSSCLNKLFYKIKCDECYCNVESIKRSVVGTGLFVTLQCISGHERDYLIPEVNSTWLKEQPSLISSLQGKPISIVGDGRCDSPGYSAKYCSYTLMDIESEKSIDFELVQVSETGSSVKMEAVGFKRCFSRFLDDHNLNVDKFASDRHVSFRKIMKDNYKGVKHNFDVFHLAKNISSKLRRIAKKKDNEDIECWIKSINNHVWWCSRNCEKDPSMLVEMWMSLTHHTAGKHSFHDDNRFTLFKECRHPAIDPSTNRRKKWLVEGSSAHQALVKVVLNKRLLNDMKHLAEFMHTRSFSCRRSEICT
ncbi:hypothetical protein HOLleu_43128 [Holothuria leucospilota]|uniref:Transposase n=1 Tax=Holothuria leucospilota TaxID=206669 RepID=A0A9Q1B949_HOLLE|nr:hypothetical protein HOLleu_43128 [Holothuria leucospilota]